ncbi:MAG: ankyrin repeat domain-containing protein [Candidatus Dependentiae bacterium]|nr:ankyrin repeat domain-containing protein [Candidatus Dependentiae bacterium]
MNYFLIISLLFSFVSVFSSDASTVASSQNQKVTLYQRITEQLPTELQDKIISYLEPAGLVERDEYLKQRDKRFKEVLNSCIYNSTLPQNEARFFKEMLRVEYFLRKYGKEQLSQVQQEYSDLCNIRNNGKYGYCVLHRAAGCRNSEIVALAVACGAEIDKKDAGDKTALWIAAQENAFGICRFLLYSGASGKIYNNELFTPLYYAIKYDSVKAVKMFQDAGVIVASRDLCPNDERCEDSLMYTAAGAGAVEVIHYLAKQGEDLNWQDRFGCTPLMRAAMRGNRETISQLLALGADPLLKNRYGRTYQKFLEK